MNRRILVICAVVLVTAVSVFAQTTVPSAGALRDYVGLINQTYHPDIVAYFEKMKADFEKKGEADAVKAIDLFLKGGTGSGFVISDAAGNQYVITNNHVIAQAYTISITFERQDGFKKRFDNLKIIASSEDTDLAILAFAPADKPLDRGLSFITRAVEEGEDVYSAGFPGMGTAALWQFGRGMVSNALARFPKSLDDDTLMGPFIQHTAQVDPGNSGGPLLVVQRGAPSGYAVAGVNTLSALWRQAANYAIPVNTTQDFITAALNPKPDTYRADLDTRLAKFVEGLGANRAAYPHIAEYLSSTCIGENAEYAMAELLNKAPRTVQRSFIEKCEDSVVGAMGYAVAWTIETSIRGQGAMKAAIKDVIGAGEEYTVTFTINNKDVTSKWVRDYGNWRIRSFGEVASGDKSLVAKKEQKKQQAENLRIKSDFNVDAGYAFLFDKASAAAYASFDYQGLLGVNVYFAGSDFWSFGLFMGAQGGIPLGSVGLTFYGRLGFQYQHDQDYEDFKKYSSDSFPSAGVFLQGGLRVTTSKVPGLFGGVAFQWNGLNVHEFMGTNKYDDAMKMGLAVTVGYSW